MELNRIQMNRGRARELWREYQSAPKCAETAEEDAAIARGYKALSEGKAIIDICAAFAHAGVDEQGRPRLAFAGATAPKALCSIRSHDETAFFAWGRGIDQRHTYSQPSINWRATRSVRGFPYPGVRRGNGNLLTPVPNVPPRFRPKRGLRWRYILWEVDEWETVPVDPFLLQRVGGYLYVVLAQWDLTDLERAVLAETRGVQ